MTTIVSQCDRCIHLVGPSSDAIRDETHCELVCSAYPKGIPYAIFWNEVDHTSPYPGDHGILCRS